MPLRLDELRSCFEGVIPSSVATCAADGTPNIAYLSQVHYLDERHVVLSRQFFNTTARNVMENPHAVVRLWDPIRAESYRLQLRFARSETQGALFDSMAVRIQAIAALTGMAGVFRLVAADVYEVEAIDGPFAEMAPDPEGVDAKELWERNYAGPRTELWAVQRLSGRINKARCIEDLLNVVLDTLGEDFGFAHARILLPDAKTGGMVVRASRGFEDPAIGRSVGSGDGLIGIAAKERQAIRLNRIEGELRYVRAIRAGMGDTVPCTAKAPPLPGLADAQSHLVLPLVAKDTLAGVLALESPTTAAFDAWHEAFLEIVCNQVAIGITQMLEDEAEATAAEAAAARPPVVAAARSAARRRFLLYKNDDCVFLDGDYLIRNVPARILWKLLSQVRDERRREFTNRELRLDPRLGLPELKDNLESRLILLRKRLEQKCPEVRLVPTARGRFAVEIDCELELIERESA